jgi:hypothetical protein
MELIGRQSAPVVSEKGATLSQSIEPVSEDGGNDTTRRYKSPAPSTGPVRRVFVEGRLRGNPKSLCRILVLCNRKGLVHSATSADCRNRYEPLAVVGPSYGVASSSRGGRRAFDARDSLGVDSAATTTPAWYGEQSYCDEVRWPS